VFNPSPDQSLDDGRVGFSFNSVVGGVTALGSRTVGLDITGEIGNVTVVT